MSMIVLLLLVGFMTLIALVLKIFGFLSWPWLIIYCLIARRKANKRFPYYWI